MCKRLFTTAYYIQLPTKRTTYNYLSTVTLHNLFTLYTFDNIGAGLCIVRIGKGGYLNVPYDIQSIYIYGQGHVSEHIQIHSSTTPG